MQLVLLDAKWQKPISATDELLSKLKGVSSVALFAATQFTRLDDFRKQLESAGITIYITKAKRTHVKMQILGCDAYHDSFEEDIISKAEAILYVGDGLFHPKALLLAQMYAKNIKPVYIFNPVLEETTIITHEQILQQVRRMRANLMMYMRATNVGILVTVKPGQQYLHNALKLKKQLDSQGKKAYIFIDDDVMLPLLENYPFVEAWVNTACPRIGIDDHVTIPQPLINIREAYDPASALQKLYSE
jgi:2-(3-amino-3-carboxypropyl)histidine synthase